VPIGYRLTRRQRMRIPSPQRRLTPRNVLKTITMTAMAITRRISLVSGMNV
jgi:hypothetical protein